VCVYYREECMTPTVTKGVGVCVCVCVYYREECMTPTVTKCVCVCVCVCAFIIAKSA